MQKGRPRFVSRYADERRDEELVRIWPGTDALQGGCFENCWVKHDMVQSAAAQLQGDEALRSMHRGAFPNNGFGHLEKKLSPKGQKNCRMRRRRQEQEWDGQKKAIIKSRLLQISCLVADGLHKASFEEHPLRYGDYYEMWEQRRPSRQMMGWMREKEASMNDGSDGEGLWAKRNCRGLSTHRKMTGPR
jgi:hypothetical protein